ncbi:unnamed protein product [Sphagnum jensenii]|uniref:Uncharacterized protein n=1 Tax=Sphagnum jensenii TaxID=128206 RepID=A0ABP0VG90_9BRYO
MILTVFRLMRDRIPPTQTIGYQRPFWNDPCALVLSRTSPPLGLPLEPLTTFNPKLFKIIEYYPDNQNRVVVERLCWAFNNLLYPYRAKYIGLDITSGSFRPYFQEKSILFLPHLSAIYRKLTGCDVLFSSPLSYCLQNHYPNQMFNPHNAINELIYEHRVPLTGLAEQDPVGVLPQDMIHFNDLLDNDAPYNELEKLFTEKIVPKLPYNDELSGRFWDRPLSLNGLDCVRPHTQPFDVGPPNPLWIQHPEVTVYSPECYHQISGAFEDISYYCTDLNLEYISSNNKIGKFEPVVYYLVSRYRSQLIQEDIVKLCFGVVTKVLEFSGLVGRDTWGPYRNTLPHPVTVSITMSYGDEVLIEIYTANRARCLYAVHLDLALLALTSSNVIAEKPIP